MISIKPRDNILRLLNRPSKPLLQSLGTSGRPLGGEANTAPLLRSTPRTPQSLLLDNRHDQRLVLFILPDSLFRHPQIAALFGLGLFPVFVGEFVHGGLLEVGGVRGGGGGWGWGVGSSVGRGVGSSVGRNVGWGVGT
jgi:hypothetical protein